MQDLSAKIIRRGPWMLLSILLILLGVAVIESYNRIGKDIKLRLETGPNFPHRTFQRIKVEENIFETGTEGIVRWKPKTFKEAFLLQTVVNKDFHISLFDIVYFLLLDVLFFWMISGVKTDNIFRLKSLSWISIPGFIMLTYLIKHYAQFFIADYCAKSLTHGQFRAADMPPFNFALVLLLFLIPFLQPFFMKAEQLENDQQLVI